MRRPGSGTREGILVIRFECEHCGKVLSVQDSRAGAVGTCPGCKERFRVPGERQPEASPPRPSPGQAKPPASRTSDAPGEESRSALSKKSKAESEERLEFSKSALRKSMVWLLCFQSLAFVVAIGSAVGCVVVVLKEKVSFEMILGVVFIALVAVVGFCYFLMALTNWRLFFFSTIPSSSCYGVQSDRLVRYSDADNVVEEIPFANIAKVRLVTRRSGENPEVTAKVLGIDLNDTDDSETRLDPQFHAWSQKMHHHDLVLIEDFFDMPIKTVHKVIKKRWKQWQETHGGSAEDEE